MKYLICIKGDGRGHITQALALAPMLQAQGHTVCAFVIGCGPETHLPPFLFQRANVPIEKFLCFTGSWIEAAFFGVEICFLEIGSIGVLEAIVRVFLSI